MEIQPTMNSNSLFLHAENDTYKTRNCKRLKN